jgi:hypothetical protein
MGSSVIGKTSPNLKPNNSQSATRITDKIPHEHVTRTDLDAIAPRHPPVTVDTCYMARLMMLIIIIQWVKTTSLNCGYQRAYFLSSRWYMSTEAHGGMISTGEFLIRRPKLSGNPTIKDIE